ncbi:MAG: septum formation inhibitor Maf [Gammaproteobacteria bacterium]|nr:septum formation inhibitor Maf [Gammaproteobacteria bacterium]
MAISPDVILASSSTYRQSLLKKIVSDFLIQSPNIDETPKPSEPPHKLAERLAIQKAEKVAESFSNHLIIGSDQVAELNGNLIGKPGNHPNAVNQLRQSSGATLTLYTGLALLNSATQRLQSVVDRYEVEFRILTDEQIEKYLSSEKPYDCCGSLKAEGSGIRLLKRLTGNDPNTLIGLPLIQLTSMLINEGVDPFDFQNTNPLRQ